MSWLKKNKSKIWKTIGFLWVTFLPLLCCMAYCLKTGNSIWDIYLPASQWNDEIIYFKEVEGMVEHGMPLGYFGYSENHALIGSLSVWSPVLLLPWYVWGLLFGWNMLSPIWCNIVLLMIAMAIFYLLAKPNGKQTVWITAFYMLFLHFTRYALSAQVEVPVYAFLIVALGLIYSMRASFSYKKLAVYYVILTLLVLMRPYLILLGFVPIYFLWKRNRKLSLVGVGIMLVQLVAYFSMTKYFCSPYLDGEGLVGFAWLETFFTDGWKAGLKNFIYIFLSSWNTYMGYIGNSLTKGSSYAENAGVMFALMFVVFCYKLVRAVSKKDTEEILWNGFWVFSFAAMFAAVVYMFGIASGQKHTLCFTVLSLFILAMEGIEMPRMLGVSFLMAYFFVFSTTGGGYAWGIPYIDMDIQAEIRKAEEVLDAEIELTDELSYDNTIVWVFDDVVGEEFVKSNWQMLYALPSGMGINMCLFDRIASDLSSIESKYIFVAKGGRTDQHCQNIGAKVLVEYGDSIIYQLRE